jgi:hypothetical protein
MSLTADQKRQVAENNGLVNVDQIWEQSAAVGLPFYIACAIMEKESHGRNVYGNDEGGALAGFPFAPNRSNYRVFRWLVFNQGQQSNGVGPAQITFKGYFPQMESEGLRPWNIGDNMLFGFRTFKGHLDAARGNVAIAGEAYNGSHAYGADLAAKASAWKSRIQR